MRDHGRVACAIWESEDFAALSEGDKLFFLYLLTSPHSNMVGVYRLTNGTASDDLGCGTDRVLKGFEELHRRDIATRCERTKWVVIHKYLKWNPVKGPKQHEGLVKVVRTMPRGAAISERVWQVINEHVQGLDPERLLAIKVHLDPKQDTNTLPLPLGIPRVSIAGAVAGAVTGAGRKAGEGASPPSPAPEGEDKPAAKVAQAYAEAFKTRYGVEPVFNAKVRGQFAQLVKRLGPRAAAVAAHYLKIDRKVYVDSQHCVDLLVRDAEGVHTEWMRSTGEGLERLFTGNWWDSTRGIKARGEELGVKVDEAETFGMYTARVFIAAGEGPWLKKADALIAGYMRELANNRTEAAA